MRLRWRVAHALVPPQPAALQMRCPPRPPEVVASALWQPVGNWLVAKLTKKKRAQANPLLQQPAAMPSAE